MFVTVRSDAVNGGKPTTNYHTNENDDDDNDNDNDETMTTTTTTMTMTFHRDQKLCVGLGVLGDDGELLFLFKVTSIRLQVAEKRNPKSRRHKNWTIQRCHDQPPSISAATGMLGRLGCFVAEHTQQDLCAGDRVR